MSLPKILRMNEISPVERGNNIKTYPLAGEMNGSTVLSNGITCFPKGGSIPLHTHNVEETVTILEGEGVCELPDGVHSVKPFDTSFVPAGVVHCFRNAGDTEMKILWVYGGTSVTRTYAETGETVNQLSPSDRVDGRAAD